MNKLAQMASKKLAFSGAVVGLIVADAQSRPAGWQAWHGYSVAFVAGCYCIAVAIHEGLQALAKAHTKPV